MTLMTHPKIRLSFSHIQQQVGTTTFQKGQGVLRHNKVNHAAQYVDEDGTMHIEACTHGSDDKVYDQAIMLNNPSSKSNVSHTALALSGFCSCTVGYNCKHVVAALLQVAEDIDNNNNNNNNNTNTNTNNININNHNNNNNINININIKNNKTPQNSQNSQLETSAPATDLAQPATPILYKSILDWLDNVQQAYLQEGILPDAKNHPSNTQDTSSDNLVYLLQYQLASLTQQRWYERNLNNNNNNKKNNNINNNNINNNNIINNNDNHLSEYNPRLIKQLTLSAHTSQPRKKGGGWLQPKPISAAYYQNLHEHHPHKETIRIIKLLSPYQALNYPVDLKGTLGQVAVDLSLKHLLVFANQAPDTHLDQLVQPGEPLTLYWHWVCLDHTLADPLWRLDWALHNQQGTTIPALFYAGLPALYLYSEHGKIKTIGNVNIGQLSEKRLHELLNAPAMPASLLQAQEQNLRQWLGDIALPPMLSKIDIKTGLPAQARLLIQRVPHNQHATQGLVNATLEFVYAHDIRHFVAWNEPSRHIALPTLPTDDGVVPSTMLLERDLASEAIWIQHLLDLGLSNHQYQHQHQQHQQQHYYNNSLNNQFNQFNKLNNQFNNPLKNKDPLQKINESACLEHAASTPAPWFLAPIIKAAKSQPNSIDLSGSPWLTWANDGYHAFKQLGFDVVLDASMADFLQTVETLEICLTNPNPNPNPDDFLPVDMQKTWFDLSLGVDLDGVRHNVLPWLPSILDTLRQAPINVNTGQLEVPQWMYLPRSMDSEQFIRVNISPLHQWLTTLLEFVEQHPQTHWQGDALRLSHIEALRASASLGEGAVWTGAATLQVLLGQLGQLRDGLNIPDVVPPPELQASLRPYQQQGLNWLQCLRQHGLSGILADDMGLGKTLQTLAHILVEQQSGRMQAPVLIIAPVSLMGNWQREAQRFTPTLRVQVFHGVERHAVGETLLNHDVVLTSYALVNREKERWLATEWHLIVLDEAQNIKNVQSHTTQAVTELKAKQRLCLSGTPIENHLGELWSLFHFLMPGFLSSHGNFTESFRTPIEKQGNIERFNQLRQRVRPFMLRRTKNIVAAELPPKIEQITTVSLTGKQADLYETIRLTTENTVRAALQEHGLARSHIMVLDALLKLRQVCCDPRLVPLGLRASQTGTAHSAKLNQLMEMLPEMLAEGRKILLFSQFTSMLTLIEAELQRLHLPWVKLTGQSKNREAIIEQFTSGQVPLFLISLKAGGVGLNLPQADTVIHYDPWWNPAVEDQATDRAHRIGQQNTVFVYKMVAQGTIEERILALQARKADLANHLYVQDTEDKDNKNNKDNKDNKDNPNNLNNNNNNNNNNNLNKSDVVNNINKDTKGLPRKALLFSEQDIMELLKPLN